MSAPTYSARRLLRPIQSLTSETRPCLIPRPASNNVSRHVTHPLPGGVQIRKASRKPAPPSFSAPPIQPMQPGNDPSQKSRGKFAPLLLGFLAVALGFYTTQIVIIATKPCQHPGIQDLSQQKDVAARYDETADGFDSDVGFSEALMGINAIRKTLSRQCKGHVLEVSCGTGRNLGYYDLSPGSEIDSLTFLDLSPQMIDVCKKKWESLYPSSTPTANKNFKPGLTIRFSTGSALETMPLAPPDGNKKYTTIIQTMGLCSTATPHKLLHNIAAHLDMSNPEARILLLEHGRSDYDWMNNILDNSAAKHAELHGCWFNRDIGGMVEAAAAESGLEIVAERRQHAGTTWVYELKPSGKAPVVAAAESTARSEGDGERAGSSLGWRSWFGLK